MFIHISHDKFFRRFDKKSEDDWEQRLFKSCNEIKLLRLCNWRKGHRRFAYAILIHVCVFENTRKIIISV